MLSKEVLENTSRILTNLQGYVNKLGAYGKDEAIKLVEIHSLVESLIKQCQDGLQAQAAPAPTQEVAK